jgi:hypothetical protein
MTTRYFQRMPCFSTEAEALAWAEEHNARVLVLHPAQSEPVVGLVQVRGVDGEVAGE